MNTLRSSDFLKIKHLIQSCEKLHQLNSLKQLVYFYNTYEKDGPELRELFHAKEKELNPEYYEEEILNIHHRKLSL